MGIVIAFTLVMIAVAYSMYMKKNSIPVAEGEDIGTAHRMVYQKYYVDEIYTVIVVKPLYWLSAKFDLVIEKLAIDRLVNSLGSTVIEGSKVFRLLQSGSIGFYIFVMVVGIVLMLTLTLMR